MTPWTVTSVNDSGIDYDKLISKSRLLQEVIYDDEIILADLWTFTRRIGDFLGYVRNEVHSKVYNTCFFLLS